MRGLGNRCSIQLSYGDETRRQLRRDAEMPQAGNSCRGDMRDSHAPQPCLVTSLRCLDPARSVMKLEGGAVTGLAKPMNPYRRLAGRWARVPTDEPSIKNGDPIA